MKKFFSVAAVFISSHLFGQKDTSILDEVVITATKFPKRQNETGKVVTIIGRDILEKSTGKSIGELLDQQAGITVTGAQSNMGTNQDVYVRGAGLGKTLILIDGVPVYDPSIISNAFELNNISLDNVERIEIVKGEQSTLYGSDAVAGVINIITKKGSNRPFHFYANLSAGSYQTFKEDAGIAGSNTRIDYNIHYTRIDTRGFSSAYDSTGTGNFSNNGFYQDVFNGSLSLKPSKNLKIRVYGQYDKYKASLDAGAFVDERDYSVTQSNRGGGVNASYFYHQGTVYFNYNYNETERKYLNDSTYVPQNSFANYTREKYTGRSHFAELYTNYSLLKHVDLLSGADYRLQNSDQEYLSASSYGSYESKLGKDSLKMQQSSVFASVIFTGKGGLQIEGGGRYSHHSIYGDNFTYSLNPSYLFGNSIKLFANLSSGFKAPTLYQLYGFGYQPLKPEKSNTLEIGTQLEIEKGSWIRGVYFNRHAFNYIDFNYATNNYFNYNKQNDHGFEIEMSIKGNKLSLMANYTYLTGEVHTLKYIFDPITYNYSNGGDTSYNNLFRRPKNSINATIGYKPTNKLYWSASLKMVGKRVEPVFGDAPVSMPAYQTVNIYGEYLICKKLKVFGDFKNITNTKYFEIRGYNSRRFNFMTGVSLKLG